MEQLDTDESLQRIKEPTRGNKVFSILRLILGSLYQDREDLTIERTSLLLDTASGIWIAKLTKIIMLESEVEQKEGRLNVTVKGSTIAEPSIQVPFTLFCSYKQGNFSRDLKPDTSGLSSLSLLHTMVHLASPMVLHNTVFSLKLYSVTSSGSKHSIGSGRGFLLFESAGDFTVH